MPKVPRLKARMDPGMAPGKDLDSISGWAWAEDRKKKIRSKAAPRIVPPPEETVPLGARWLDIMAPGWFRRVEPDHVDVQSVTGDPLANAFPRWDGKPDFAEGIRRLCRPTPVKVRQSSLLSGPLSLSGGSRPKLPVFKGVDTDQLAAYGFAPYRDDPSPDPYPVLNRLWAAEIERRLKASLSKLPNVVAAAQFIGG